MIDVSAVVINSQHKLSVYVYGSFHLHGMIKDSSENKQQVYLSHSHSQKHRHTYNTHMGSADAWQRVKWLC